MVWSSVSHSQFSSWLSLKYHHFVKSTLKHLMPVLILLGYFHIVHIGSAPAGSSSQRLGAIGVTGWRSEGLSFHTLKFSGMDVDRGSTLFRKFSLDPNWLAAAPWLKRGYRMSLNWRVHSYTPSNIRWAVLDSRSLFTPLIHKYSIFLKKKKCLLQVTPLLILVCSNNNTFSK